MDQGYVDRYVRAVCDSATLPSSGLGSDEIFLFGEIGRLLPAGEA